MASEAKKCRLSDELDSLRGFKISKVLDENADAKKIFIEGKLGGDDENTAVLILEKMPFNPESLQDILQQSTLKIEFKNDIYGKYECYTEPKLNSLKANLIYPATSKHIAKYTSSTSYVINESAALYQTVTLPYIKSEKFTIDWVYNILDHKKETERIVYEDPDADSGFVLLPDYKWSCKQVEDLYLIAIIHNRKIKSIRDLNHRHLHMLEKILKDGSQAIYERYGVPHAQLRIYFHYQPSYYHLHVHFTHMKYNAPGSNVDHAHLLSTVIHNIRRQSHFYAQALLPFSVKESSGLYKAYVKAGYDFGHRPQVDSNGSASDPKSMDKLFIFFKALGKAKHEPCGEHWDVTYGESAWRLAVMAMCLSPDFNRKRLVKIALSSAFTCVGKEPDENAEWESKLNEVREFLCGVLPLERAAELFELYSCHVSGRRGVKPDSIESRAYRKLLELEEAILLWEEQRKEEGETKAGVQHLMRWMREVGFPGTEQPQLKENDESELNKLLAFFLKVSDLVRLKRTGWVRSGVRDPERVAGHMFRMAAMAMLLDDPHDQKVLNGSAVILSLVHDIAECIVGDITPSDPVSAEDKHAQEMRAMSVLVENLPTSRIALEFSNAFERYEVQDRDDEQAKITKDLDKFDMIMQAFEYEEKVKKGPFLEDFFESTKGVIKHAEVAKWDAALRAKRTDMHQGQ